MTTNVYLICLRSPDPGVLEAIRQEWPDDRYEITDTQVLVAAGSNGGKSVYDRLEERYGQFAALIVRFRHYHGRHNSELWEWLAARSA